MKIQPLKFYMPALLFALLLFFATSAAATCGDGADGVDDNLNCAADDATTVTTGTGNDTVNLNGFTIAPPAANAGIVAGGNLTVNGAGTVSTSGANGFGIHKNNDGTVQNSATISTTGDNGIGIIHQGSNGTITNTGNISTSGISAEGIIMDNGTITNTGNVNTSGDISTGIFLNVSGLIDNSGTVSITGSGAAAIVSNGNLTNSGTIFSQQHSAIASNSSAQSITINSGTVTGGNGTAIDTRAGNDSVTINTASTINGTLDGGADTDTLHFAGMVITVSPAEQAAIIAYLVDTNAPNGNITLGGKTYTWTNFEVLGQSLVFVVIDPASGAAGTLTLSPPPPAPTFTEIACGVVKVFNTADGFVQVYSGFETINVPNGFLVAVFARNQAQTGAIFGLGGSPNWSVVILPDQALEVLDENGALVGGCRF